MYFSEMDFEGLSLWTSTSTRNLTKMIMVEFEFLTLGGATFVWPGLGARCR